jgi:hypothetical protein
MSQPTFKPRVEELVKASPPHPPDTYYRVAIGREAWGGESREVEKVQMVYGGRVAGRKAPSYPADRDDAERVFQALERLRQRARAERPGHAFAREQRRPLTLVDLIGSARGLYGTPEDVQNARDELRDEWP